MADSRYEPRGGARELFLCKNQAVLLHGPRGSSKTTAALNKVFGILANNPNSRGLLLRQTRESLNNSALETWESHILGPNHPMLFNPEGKRLIRRSRPDYQFPNGSVLVLGGLEDGGEKYKGADFDVIMISQAEDIQFEAYQTIIPCLRNHTAKYHQLILECNPSYSSHWLINTPEIKTIKSRYEDNPLYWDIEKGDWAAEGRRYVLGIIDKLVGVAYLRHRKGIWANAEGAVYKALSRKLAPEGHLVLRGDLDFSEFEYFIGGIDWGYSHPCSIALYGVRKDGSIVLVDEIYQTELEISDIIEKLKILTKRYVGYAPISCWIADSNEPSHIESCCRAGFPVRAAKKKGILHGISLVQTRLIENKLHICDPPNSSGECDEKLNQKAKPTNILMEFETYIWVGKGKDKAVDDNNHSLDQLRYVCEYLDTGSGLWCAEPTPEEMANVQALDSDDDDWDDW